ncbi:efflux RND transporter periplasmic adaptor subunit [Caulobacter rhizosphaerae]|uniref:efflux RND transporter periplasmic adaptor subunit n=1 Tax=Caulobacter rhizosphaerae TaxID=2010972 RepID=UPI0019A1532D|nr:efflux RND transporter periplasmic adaptor subunit [Caulobacter rhizosphaerae]GGL11536.1 metal transporter [Caulobacter rhizosphaerae]
MIVRRSLIVSAIALIAAAGLGYGAAQLFQDRPAAPAPASEKDGVEHGDHGETGLVPLKPADAAAAGVSIVPPRRGGGVDILLPGRVTLAANALAALGAPVSGAVERVHVSTGAAVAIGSPIATLRSADAALGRASLDAAGAGARAAQAAAIRDRRLFEAGVVSRQDWETSQAAAEKAQADQRAAQAQVRAMGGPGANGVAVLRSPIKGVVTRLDAQVGGFLTQGALVAEIADPSRAEYVFDAPAAAAGSIRLGQVIQVQTPDGQQVPATISAVAPGASGGNTAAVRATPSDRTAPIGSVVSARVMTGAETGGAIIVPSEAVQAVEGRPVVFVVEAGGFRATPVTPGRIAAGSTEILRGLTGTERIAGKGAFLLKAELGKGEAGHED